jgi:2-polyprenyl-6-methoxyphenol hydroxylase-like FAD-dependent oxidoreductase
MENGMNTDVLIVGAGPTGLMLANQLARRGVRTLIIDRNSGPVRETRALGVQARTLEIYAKLGVIERALALGKSGVGGNIWAQGRRAARLSLGDAGEGATPYPYILILGQDDNERILGAHLNTLGVSVQWNNELIGLDQQADHVTASLKRADGTIFSVSARWVAGCDGAHSAVRKLTGIAFPGAPYEHVFFVADVVCTGSMVPDELNVYLWRKGFHLFFPMRGDNHWRIVGIVPPNVRQADVTLADVMPSMRDEAGPQLAIEACDWFATYRIHHRGAAQFRKGRCFVLGDAAHIHSPVGAQGMNTGLQDATNLAWKLALVVAGKAQPSLLDSYEEERLPVAQRLLDTTDRAFRLVVSDSWFAGLFRTAIMARLAALMLKSKRLQRMAFRVVSQIGITYRGSRLSRSHGTLPAGAPQAGDRFPWLRLTLRPDGPMEDCLRAWSDTAFNLILFGQALPEGETIAASELVQVHVVPSDADNERELARAQIAQPSFYLIRPDGHVGLCGERVTADAVREYLAQIGVR